jgi:DNA invertase Pin-like site-specific DNA recombinase
MNIAVGYIQASGDDGSLAKQQHRLMSVGCDTVRVEQSQASDQTLKPVLSLVCEFLDVGDELVVPDLTHLGPSPGPITSFVARVEARGASLRVLDAGASTRNGSGRALIDVLSRIEAAAEPSKALHARRTVDARTVWALSARGLGPSQIAKRLGVSRMTVWRKLAEERGA